MDIDTSDYFAYKKSKLSKKELNKKENPTSSNFGFFFQLFFATFVVIFIIIVIAIMKYSSRMDIEYEQGDLSINPEITNDIPNFAAQPEEEQKRIDKRLNFIQQEENAPSEAKIIAKDKQNKDVIDPVHLETNKRLEKQKKIEKLKAQNLEQEKTAKAPEKKEEVKLAGKKTLDEISYAEKNVTIMSKVLIGKYPTFDEAQVIQEDIKANNPQLSPYVRKIGNVFAVQMGSHQDFSVAKAQAQILKSKGYDVWIYQQ